MSHVLLSSWKLSHLNENHQYRSNDSFVGPEAIKHCVWDAEDTWVPNFFEETESGCEQLLKNERQFEGKEYHIIMK